MPQSELLIGPATLITNHASNPVLQEAGVLCSNGRIAAVGPYVELKKAHGAAKLLDAEGKVVMPAMVNAHHHFYSTFARGMPLAAGTQLRNFKEVLEGIWWRLDRALDLDAVQAGAWPPLLDSLRWGAGTVVDHHASPSAIRGSLDALAAVCGACGLRAALCYEITDRNGIEDAVLGLEENLSFISRNATDRLRGLIGLHASFTVSDETLELVRRTAPSDVPVHIHTAEDGADTRHARKKHGCGVVERLEAHGLLRRNSVLAHGVHLKDDELKAIGRAGAFLVHNPESNANNAVGALDLVHAMELGVTVAVGTDGMASNMLRAAKSAYLMARHVRKDPGMGIDLCRKLLLEANMQLARELFANPRIGMLAPESPADLMVVDYLPPTPLTADTLDGHLTFGITESPILATVTDGVVRMDRKGYAGLDMNKTRKRLDTACAGVWKKLS
jgi:putative selenium metabolism protein SsnA